MGNGRVKCLLFAVSLLASLFIFQQTLIPVHAYQKLIYITTQRFEHGLMIFRKDNADVWVLLDSDQAYYFAANSYNQYSDQTAVANPDNHILPIFRTHVKIKP